MARAWVPLLLCSCAVSTQGTDKIYWTNFLKNEIMRANLADGGDVEQVVGSDGASLPWGLVVHPVTCSLYWADVSSKSIKRSQLDGSEVQTYLPLDEAAFSFWLAPGDDTLYWTQRNGKIFRINLATAGATAELRAQAKEELETSYSGYYYNRLGIAVDRTQVPPNVYVSETEEWVLSKQTWGVNADDTWWVEDWDNIWSPEGMTIDESTREIYWVDKGYRDIRKTTLAGGDSSVQVLVSGLDAPHDLEIFGQHLYYSDWGLGGNSALVQVDHTGVQGWRIDFGVQAGPSGIAIMNSTLVSASSCSTAAPAAETTVAPTEVITETVIP